MKDKKTSACEQLGKRIVNLQNGRDEMNLCELPFATLSERAGSRNTLRFEVDDYDHGLKQTVRRSLTVKGDPEHGLPTGKDEEIYLGLLKYTSDYNGCSDPEVHFSRSELFELMGWKKTDWAYSRLVLGMHRLVGVRLSYQNLWRDNRDKQWRDQGGFGILDSFRFLDRRALRTATSFSEQSSMFCWSAVLFQSFDSGYLKRIDYRLARNLSVTARRLYRYLDKHFHPPHKTRIEIDLSTLAYQHIGISPGIELDKVRKRYIGLAAEELQDAGYLKPATAKGHFERIRRGEWNAIFDLATASAGKNEQDRNATRLVQALCQRGLTETAAVRLSNQHTKTVLKQAIRAMDEQRRNGNPIRSPDRWFSAAIARGYQPTIDNAPGANRPERRVFRKGQFRDADANLQQLPVAIRRKSAG